MLTSFFSMGIILIVIGIAIRLAFGVSFEDPFAFITVTPPTDLQTYLQESGEYLIKFTSSGIWTAGIIFVIIGIVKR